MTVRPGWGNTVVEREMVRLCSHHRSKNSAKSELALTQSIASALILVSSPFPSS